MTVLIAITNGIPTVYTHDIYIGTQKSTAAGSVTYTRFHQVRTRKTKCQVEKCLRVKIKYYYVILLNVMYLCRSSTYSHILIWFTYSKT